MGVTPYARLARLPENGPRTLFCVMGVLPVAFAIALYNMVTHDCGKVKGEPFGPPVVVLFQIIPWIDRLAVENKLNMTVVAGGFARRAHFGNLLTLRYLLTHINKQ